MGRLAPPPLPDSPRAAADSGPKPKRARKTQGVTAGIQTRTALPLTCADQSEITRGCFRKRCRAPPPRLRLDSLMSRAPLLRLLHAHHPLDAHESAMLAATIRFVATEPRCAERSLASGHLTGSAWIVDPARTSTLLTHHRKLDLWLQLGGHADGDLDLAAVALREAREESGLASVRPLDTTLFDVDRHWIPDRPTEPGHWHYDLRFFFVADPAEPLVITPESKALAWVNLDRLSHYTTEASLIRLARRTARR